MADVVAENAELNNGKLFAWKMVFDDSANTVMFQSTITNWPDGSPADGPFQQADVTVILNTSLNATVSHLDGKIVAGPGGLAGQDFSQASPGQIFNEGQKVRTGVKLKVSADRARLVSHLTTFRP